MPSPVASQLLANVVGGQLFGGKSNPEDAKVNQSPEYAAAAWWKKQMPHWSDQQAWEAAQGTLAAARGTPVSQGTPWSNGGPNGTQQDLNMLRALGIYQASRDPGYEPPTTFKPGGRERPFGPPPSGSVGR